MDPIDLKILQASWEIMMRFSEKCYLVGENCLFHLFNSLFIYVDLYWEVMPFCLGLNMIKLVYFTFSESLFALNQVDDLLSSKLRKVVS